MFTNSIETSLLVGKRVFIVEDDVLNLAVATKILSKSGAFIYHNYNSIGIVAHVVENLPIDIVLLDISLRRGVSGYDVIRHFKDNPHTKAIPVVAVTSTDPETGIPRAKSLGFDGFISKPINVRSFARDLLSIMQGDQRWIISHL